MNPMLRTCALLTLTSTMLALVACQKTEDASAAPVNAASAAAASTARSVSSADDSTTLRIVDASGTALVVLKPHDMEVRFGNGDKARTLHAQSQDDGKRKYARQGEGVVMEVKPGDDGFKLRSRDAHLLWKLKLKDSSIKISDNEENARAITLKINGNRIEVADNGKALGEVNFDGDKSRARVTDAADKTVATVQAKKNSAAFGLLLATRIPEAERAVLALELLARDL
ncbi:MAG TPA: hypothetical protein VLC92_15360 [Rhodocyclaceae bacterium]|nr:hypothetical protein [Rhodocyclaceae bacterium]